MKKTIYIIDAYNVIGQWPTLSQLKIHNRLPEARDLLLKILSEYQDFNKLNILVVFDAMYVPTPEQRQHYHHLHVVWTQRDQTADSYIEAYVRKHRSVLRQYVVVTSDHAEQDTVMSAGAIRMPDSELLNEIDASKSHMESDVKDYQEHVFVKHSPWNQKQLKALTNLRNRLSKK